MIAVRNFKTLLAAVLLAGVLAASGCGSGEDIESLPEAKGRLPGVESTKPPHFLAVNETATITAYLVGPPDEVLTYQITSGGGVFTNASGTVTLDGSGQGQLTLSYTATPTPGIYNHAVFLSDSQGRSGGGGFATREVPPMGTLLATITAPGGENMGLTYDGANLWVASRITDIIYKLNPADGSVLDAFPNPTTDTRGLVWYNAHLWVAEGASKTIREVDPATGVQVGSVNPAVGGTYISGMAYDGSLLYISAYNDGLIHKADPGWNVIGSIPSSAGAGNRGMTFAKSVLFHVDGNCASVIHKIVPADGTVLGTFTPAGGGCNDLAFDGSNLWVSDWSSTNLYKYSPGTIPAP